MNEKMDKRATKTEKDDGMVFQYRNKAITPDMDGLASWRKSTMQISYELRYWSGITKVVSFKRASR